MKVKLIAPLAAGFLACFAATGSYAAQTVVTFDDLSGYGVVSDGYGGITWGGQWHYYDSYQPPYTPHSDPSRVYDFVEEGTFSFSSPVVFDGAYFSGNSYATVTFNLYNGANLVWTSATLSPSSTPTWLASGYSGLVTRVGVVSPSPDFFVMDDVTYGVAAPEPATWAMMLAGFAGLGFAGYRTSRRSLAKAA